VAVVGSLVLALFLVLLHLVFLVVDDGAAVEHFLQVGQIQTFLLKGMLWMR